MTAPVPSIAEVEAMFMESHRTHWVGCETSHKGCAVLAVLRAVRPLLERHRGTLLARQQRKHKGNAALVAADIALLDALLAEANGGG